MSRDDSDEDIHEGPLVQDNQHNLSTDLDVDHIQRDALQLSIEQEEEEAAEKEKLGQGKMMKQEQEEDIDVTFKTYRSYFGNYWGKWFFAF